MSIPVSRPTVAASEPVDPRESGGAGPAAVEALARILDPVAFDPRAVPKNLGQDWDKVSRQMVAREHAERALAAGYRLVSEEPGS